MGESSGKSLHSDRSKSREVVLVGVKRRWGGVWLNLGQVEESQKPDQREKRGPFKGGRYPGGSGGQPGGSDTSLRGKRGECGGGESLTPDRGKSPRQPDFVKLRKLVDGNRWVEQGHFNLEGLPAGKPSLQEACGAGNRRELS